MPHSHRTQRDYENYFAQKRSMNSSSDSASRVVGPCQQPWDLESERCSLVAWQLTGKAGTGKPVRAHHFVASCHSCSPR